jgi:hypothetical protein
MNYSDAVEGVTKAVLARFLDLSTEYRMETSEYIRTVNAVVDAVVSYVKNNPEISQRPDVIKSILRDYARTQWLARLEKTVASDPSEGNEANIEYQAYCYDYLCAHGNYPR